VVLWKCGCGSMVAHWFGGSGVAIRCFCCSGEGGMANKRVRMEEGKESWWLRGWSITLAT